MLGIQSVLTEPDTTLSVWLDKLSAITDCIGEGLFGPPSSNFDGPVVVVSAGLVAVGASSMEGLVVGAALGTRDRADPVKPSSSRGSIGGVPDSISSRRLPTRPLRKLLSSLSTRGLARTRNPIRRDHPDQ